MYINFIIASVANAGIITGTAMFQYTLKFVQPSILAASTNSSGTLLLIYCLIQNIPKASIKPGTMIAFKSFSQSSSVMMKYCGIKPSCGGIIIVTKMARNRKFFPLNSNFANAKPANEHKNKTPIVVIVDTIREFQIAPVKSMV